MQNPKNQNIDLATLYKIQYGLYIITTKYKDKINGQIATTIFQVTHDPIIQLALCLCKDTYTHELVTKSKIFGVSILEQSTPLKFIGNFGFRCGREFNKFAEVKYETNITGCPLVTDHSIAIMEAEVNRTLDVGTHMLFIGELKSAKKISDGAAMTYEYYHTNVKGKAPASAPTYQKS